MTELPIKDFEFANFFERDWFNWRLDHLETLIIEGKEKGTGEAPNLPIIFKGADAHFNAPEGKEHETHSDWRFLSQFHPEHWKFALHWRYNEGLKQAHKLRREHPEKRLTDFDYVDKFVFNVPSGKGVAKDPIVQVEYLPTTKHPITGKPAFYVGLESLIKRLEHPPFVRQDHKEQLVDRHGEDYEFGDKSLSEIDPNQHDPNHPEWHGHYKGGLYGFDISNLSQLTPEAIDAIPPEELDLPKELEDLDEDHPKKQEAIRKKKAYLKKNLETYFGGFSALKTPEAKSSLQNWMKAVGLGIIRPDELPKNIVDPNTKSQHDIEYLTGKEIHDKMQTKDFHHDVGHGTGRWRLTREEARTKREEDLKRKAQERLEKKEEEIRKRQEKEREEARARAELLGGPVEEWLIFIENEEEPASYKIKNLDGSEQEVKGRNIPLTVPAIRKKFRFYNIRKSGAREYQEVDAYVPVLTDGKLTPTMGGQKAMSPEQLAAIGTRKKGEEKMVRVEDVLDHLDLLTPDQLNRIMDKSRHKSEIHRLVHQYNRMGERLAGGAQYEFLTMGGFWPTRGSLSVASPLPPKYRDAIIEKYRPLINQEVAINIGKWIESQEKKIARNDPADPATVDRNGLNTLREKEDQLREEITDIIMERLNHPTHGIRDEKLGLNMAPGGEEAEKMTKQFRRTETIYLLRDAAKSLGIPIQGRMQALDAPVGKGEEGEPTTRGAFLDTGAGATRVGHRTERPHKEGEPILGKQKARKERIQDLTTDTEERLFDRAVDFINAQGDKLGTLYTMHSQRLQAQGMTDKQKIDSQAKEAAMQAIKQEMIKRIPAVANLGERLQELRPDWEGILGRKEKMATLATGLRRGPAALHDEAMEEFIDNLWEKGEGLLPTYSSEAGEYIGTKKIVLKDLYPIPAGNKEEIGVQMARKAIEFIETLWGKGAIEKDWGDLLLQAIYKVHGRDLGEDKAERYIQMAKGQIAPTTTPTPRPVAAPAPSTKAARPLYDLFQNIPANMEELITRKEEIKRDPKALAEVKKQFAISQLRGDEETEAEIEQLLRAIGA